ncbi:hypothetical protein [Ascidiimonas sp. W6]|uniref:hypothetical protein n=1 Tax=Ascidiimonas meishanensis TaxID=3128903 RepID=UPI0030EBA5FD
MPNKKKLTHWILIFASLIMSGTAIFLSLQKDKKPTQEVIEKSPDVLKQERLDSVAFLINQLVEKESTYQMVAFHPMATKGESANASLNFRTQVVSLLSKITTLASEEELALLNDELLIQFAKFENEYGDKELAVKTFEYLLTRSNNLILKEQALSQLSVLYADRTSLLFNPTKVRVLQKNILAKEKKQQSKDRYERLANLYEEWAKTEYIQLRDTPYGNKVLDSAFYCVGKLPDYLSYKDSLLRRLTSIYNYHNDIITSKTISGDYKFYVNNLGMGTANIAVIQDEITIRINYLENDKLVGQIKGVGVFTDPEMIIFDVTLKSYSEKFETFRDGIGTLELITAPNFLLKGSLKEFGKDAVELRLLKNPNAL